MTKWNSETGSTLTGIPCGATDVVGFRRFNTLHTVAGEKFTEDYSTLSRFRKSIEVMELDMLTSK